MLSLMSKYLENHDGDGVVLFYCFLKHFAGATKANIIAAYAELTEAKVQLHLFNNNVSTFTNAVRIPTCKLVNCQKQPTFQHMLNVYDGVMDCPNAEFSNYIHNLYREYRSDIPAASWSMFQLLDTLDQEYERLQALNHWEPRQLAKNPEILALTAELSSLKAYVAKLQKTPSNPNGNTKKPTQPPKEKLLLSMALSGITVRNVLVEKGLGIKLTPLQSTSKALGKVTKTRKLPVLLFQDFPVLLPNSSWKIWLVLHPTLLRPMKPVVFFI